MAYAIHGRVHYLIPHDKRKQTWGMFTNNFGLSLHTTTYGTCRLLMDEVFQVIWNDDIDTVSQATLTSHQVKYTPGCNTKDCCVGVMQNDVVKYPQWHVRLLVQ